MIRDNKIKDLERDLMHEVGLSSIQAKAYLWVNVYGRMDAHKISRELNVTYSEAQDAAESLIALGGFIEYGESEYEAMHPRFTAVNMYRRKCERLNVPFARNKTVDNIGAVLEESYDSARTK
ncbi:MAG: TrmB family transcriptional regulator [Cenarchaeum sp. SB0661_bin_35]|nr:TrmB family transcriptional regulator [Cenarchaeum sp. SB0667_bin_13]MXY37760.1 TrmB family transcriptional regulator [Cenarchaeum sp. SB0664_bin_35]MXZ93892.1 TrmB family transcriptional regulator [Cenarchaeum sp. SB0666_bin_15]MYB46148.1 TrmB family transcriptional regulator [Cenarchaeum sp. SB0662_bin_33]MYC79127.1 TrmB family transcriptional regulator [Cenarchaeum sp. SB0661_bin_35]MYD59155.1 TrmB family transcriptional regulator [Cenarchaeum sp. SB0678_bin_8]MYI51823.1 TrmB family tra